MAAVLGRWGCDSGRAEPFVVLWAKENMRRLIPFHTLNTCITKAKVPYTRSDAAPPASASNSSAAAVHLQHVGAHRQHRKHCQLQQQSQWFTVCVLNTPGNRNYLIKR